MNVATGAAAVLHYVQRLVELPGPAAKPGPPLDFEALGDALFNDRIAALPDCEDVRPLWWDDHILRYYTGQLFDVIWTRDVHVAAVDVMVAAVRRMSRLELLQVLEACTRNARCLPAPPIEAVDFVGDVIYCTNLQGRGCAAVPLAKFLCAVLRKCVPDDALWTTLFDAPDTLSVVRTPEVWCGSCDT